MLNLGCADGDGLWVEDSFIIVLGQRRFQKSASDLLLWSSLPTKGTLGRTSGAAREIGAPSVYKSDCTRQRQRGSNTCSSLRFRLGARNSSELRADGEGFERVSSTTCGTSPLPQLQKRTEAESEAVCPDSDLQAVVEAWSGLPDAIKAGILARIRAVK
jgi:hypothetical protein